MTVSLKVEITVNQPTAPEGLRKIDIKAEITPNSEPADALEMRIAEVAKSFVEGAFATPLVDPNAPVPSRAEMDSR